MWAATSLWPSDVPVSSGGDSITVAVNKEGPRHPLGRGQWCPFISVAGRLNLRTLVPPTRAALSIPARFIAVPRTEKCITGSNALRTTSSGTRGSNNYLYHESHTVKYNLRDCLFVRGDLGLGGIRKAIVAFAWDGATCRHLGRMWPNLSRLVAR